MKIKKYLLLGLGSLFIIILIITFIFFMNILQTMLIDVQGVALSLLKFAIVVTISCMLWYIWKALRLMI